ncbi:membrane fusion protein, Cu(I)/Ag(I) efflux system [Tenacibaculum sp. MAR_2009_124]|uniref:efflux RND transporter periplasmic adaptor subunit n=1 Tax=Tenacibaculum sp. MAR_2009_124 TaxID=1250059 RepID=UPI000898C825|nr:efflux RND transporter periplasmic adaptor subunit [Tenacibaculum sp. MAR_2009_124]SEB87845.1 membrane fusion protein, Cu(I)/Ag(I) efflux system [Tenacibaculum sp. MAR_2009_124]
MKKYILYVGLVLLGVMMGKFLLPTSLGKEDSHVHFEKAVNKTEFWTCSMHPQIRQTEPGDCPICGMDLIPAEVGEGDLMANQFKMTKNAIALGNIQTMVVGMDTSGKSEVMLSGKIVENEQLNTIQSSYFSGRIESLKVNFTGEKVSKGQLLATIYSPGLVKAQQELLTAASLKEIQPALYKAVRNKLRLWKLSDNQINQIEKSKKVKENFPVYATVSGTVLEKMVEVGDYVKQGQGLFKMANLNNVWASFDVYENQISLFKTGQTIEVESNAFAGKTFKAKVSFIDPTVNPNTRVVKLRANLSNSEQKFKPGMFIKGTVERLELNEKKSIVIPASAVLWTGKRSVVYVKPKKEVPVFEMREVILGNKNGDMYAINKGISSGDEIVTNGVFTVDASAQLHGKKSMMNHQKSIQDTFEVVPDFIKQLQSSYNSYIEVKNALVKTDKVKASEMAKEFNMNLAHIDSNLLSNKARKQWMLLENVMESSSLKIEMVETIQEQRAQFRVLSNHLILAIELFGIQETVYKQYCPMANSDKGAYWLSKEKQITNPYFGDKMLKCGEVKQVINHLN